MSAAVKDPKARTDQKCVQCGKPKKRTRTAAQGSNPKPAKATRMGRDLWLTELDADPFCSRPCCEAFHGTADHRALATVEAAA